MIVIVPILGGPLAILLSFLPQIVLAVGAALVGWFARSRLARIGKGRLLALGACVAGGVVAWAVVGTGGAGGALPPVAADWETFRGGPDRRGARGAGSLRAGVKEAWRFRGLLRRGMFASSPAVVGDRVYVGCEDDRVYAFDRATGEVAWSFPTLHPVFSSPAVAGGRVYVGEGLHKDLDCSLHCLDAATGRLLWKFPTKGHVESSPAVLADRVILGAGPDGVYALDLDGRPLWHLEGPHADGAFLVAGDRVLFDSGYEDGAVYAVSLDDGRVLWRRPVGTSAWGPPARAGDRALFGTGHRTFAAGDAPAPGKVLCLSLADGEECWAIDLPDVVMSTFAVRGALACFGCADGTVRMVRVADGGEEWSCKVGDCILGSPAWGQDAIVAGTCDGFLSGIDPADGRILWRFDARAPLDPSGQGILSSPAIVDNRIYVGGPSLDFLCLEAVVR